MILSSINETVGLIVFFGILAVTVFLIIFLYLLNKKMNKRVLLASAYIREIKELNDKFTFKDLLRTSDTKTFQLNSKRAFDNFDPYKKRDEYIKVNLSYFQQLVETVTFNTSLFVEYKRGLSQIKQTADESIAKANKMSLKSFRKRELKLGKKLVKDPQMNYWLRIKWEYTSPAGRNYYSDYQDSTFSDVKSIVQRLALAVKPKERHSDTQQRKTPAPSKGRPTEKIITSDDIEDVKE